MKFNKTLTQAVKSTIETGSIPMLLGEPGIGKSSWLIDLAQAMNTRCFVLACNQLADKADLTGARLVPDNNDGYKQVFYPHQIIADAITYAEENPDETPLLFMDEINRTTPDVTSAALSIPTLRSIGSIQLPDNLRVVIAGNDKGNVTSLDEASISRFVLFRVEPDTETFLDLDPELNVWIRKVLIKEPKLLFGKKYVIYDSDEEADAFESIDDFLDVGEEMNQLTAPRTISALSRFLNNTSKEELMNYIADSNTDPDTGQTRSALQDIVEGFVGQTRFANALLDTIIEDLSKADEKENAQVTKIPSKPKRYDEMKTFNNITELENFITNELTDEERFEYIVYALYENVDNSVWLKALASQWTEFHSEITKSLIHLSSHDMLDKENVEFFLQLDLPQIQMVEAILSL